MQPGTVFLLGVLLFALQPMELLALILAASVHELGHLLMLWILGIRVSGITLAMTGPVLNCASGTAWYEEMLSALAGPGAGLLLCCIAASHWQLLCEISLFLSLLNLLPILPLDGGRALHAVLTFLFPASAADSICSMLSVFLCGAMLVCGLFAATLGYGVTTAVFAGWLTVLACQAHGIVVE